MQLTKRASYGLIATVELAIQDGETPVSAGAIAQKYALPAPFVEKILHQLKASGLVLSRKGRGGGYLLAGDPTSVTVREVLEALEESLDLVGCIGSESDCTVSGSCPTRHAWETIDRRFKELLGSLSLADLVAG
jgi:Rrf2 family protein